MKINSFSGEERTFLEELIKDREENARVIQKRSMRGVERDVVDKYPDSAHFIYELLQNADDAKATKISIRLEQNGLIFKHNGLVHFTITDPLCEETDDIIGHINSITSVGASTKEQNDNTIGKFGVGFKAVFQYTNTPHIYDTKFKFLIKNLFVPALIEDDHSWRNDDETLFWLPFDRVDKAKNESYKEILQKLEELDNPILFLRSLLEIEWQSNDGSGVYKKCILQAEIINNIECQLIDITNNTKQNTLWLFTQDVEISNVVVPISAGIYMDRKTNKLSPIGAGKMYCFFPIKDSVDDLGFILHAPFELVSSRQNIKDNYTNLSILKKLANLSAQTLICLRYISEKYQIQYLDNRIFRFIPQIDYWNKDKRKAIFYEALEEVFSEERILLSDSKKYIYAENAFLTSPINLIDLFDTQRLNLLLKSENNEFLKSDYSANDSYILDILNKIGVKTLSTDDFAEAITESFMKAQTIEWLHKFYQFIYEDAKNLWNVDPRQKKRIYKLRQKPIILLESGEYMSPDSSIGDINVFYSSDVGAFTNNVVSSSLLEIKSTKDFFAALGIKEPDMYDYITTQILPQYTKNDVEIDNNEIIQHIKILFDYSGNCPTNKRTDYIEKLSSTLLLVAKNSVTGESHLHKPSEIYENNEQLIQFFYFIEQEEEKCHVETWKKHYIDYYGESVKCLKCENGKYTLQWSHNGVYDYDEKVYKPKSEYLFLDTAFYGDLLKDFKIMQFISELGIMQYPELSKLEDRIFSSRDWINRRYRDLSSITPVGQDLSGYIDYDLEKLENFLAIDLTFENSKLLWDILCRIDSRYYRAEFRFHPYGGQYAYDPRKEYHSKFIDDLRNIEWLYTSDKRLVKPSEIIVSELHGSYIRKAELIEVLGFKNNTPTIDLPPDIQAKIDRADKFGDLSDEDLAVAKANKQKREARERRRQEKQNRDDDFFGNRDESTPKSTADLFANNYVPPTTPKQQQRPSVDKSIENLIKKQKEEIEEQSRINDLRTEVVSLDKYSYKWFTSLLQLEYNASGEESYGSRAISINFGRVEKESSSERIYILKNPSRIIPTSLEEVGGLSVRFIFPNNQETVIGFEVANVKDRSLWLKAKISDKEELVQVDFSRCLRAVVDVNNPIQLLDKLKRAYTSLGYDDTYNLKDNLNSNISFVFGPPGTGKTTHLSKEIIKLVENNKSCKILVLTPTNKACDVIANKILDIYKEDEKDAPTWISRFVATSDETLEWIVQGRDSRVYEDDNCCLISTIARYPYDKFSNSNYDVLLKDVEWDYIIIDEASMIPLSYITYVIYTQQTKNIIIAGDPLQIAPIIHEPLWEGENIYTMVDLQSFDNPKTTPIQFNIKNLDTQYRSVPSIGSLFSNYAYNGKLKHDRAEDSKKELEIDGFEIKGINYLPFKVVRNDSMYGVKKLSSSNIHIYSALFVFELIQYLEKQISSKYEDVYRIGVICPYAAQAQLIEKLFEQHTLLPNIELSVGTIHGFQGDQCDIVFAVFNPPMGLKREPEKTFINNQNIVNVAISRARDYLFIVMPNNDMEDFENLYQLNALGQIIKDNNIDSATYHCFDVEELALGGKRQIEHKTIVTTHQMANVYSNPELTYEVRIDESAIDIQINLDLE